MLKRLATVLMLAALPASAQFATATYCTNCATWITQATQYAQELTTALRAVQMVTMMTTEAQQLAQHPSTNISYDLAMLSGLMMQAQGLAGTAAQLSQQFYNTYAPYSPNPVVNYASQYNQWATTTQRTLNGALMTTGYQGSMLSSEAGWTQLINQLNGSTLGRDESIQLTNSIATQQVAQLQSLRFLMSTELQAQAAFMGQQVAREQSAVAANQNAFGYATPVATNRGW